MGARSAGDSLMFIIVCYDIVDNKRRSRIAKVMKSYGYRVQKSVFECQLDDDRKYLQMKKAIEKTINREEDSVRYYFLCARCQGNVEVSGWGVIREEEDVIVV